MTGTEQVLNFQCQAMGTPTLSLMWSKEGGAQVSITDCYAGLLKQVSTLDHFEYKV